MTRAYMSPMSTQEDLRGLLLRKGKTQAEAGINRVYASTLATGRRRAGADAIRRMAAALSVTTDEVYAACTESCRRASADPASVSHT